MHRTLIAFCAVSVSILGCHHDKQEYETVATAINPTIKELAPLDRAINTTLPSDISGALVAGNTILEACAKAEASVDKLSNTKPAVKKTDLVDLDWQLVQMKASTLHTATTCAADASHNVMSKDASACMLKCVGAWTELSTAIDELGTKASKEGVVIEHLKVTR